jgi:hypothetical protein
VLHTEQLLRAPEPDDAAAMFPIMADHEVMRYFGAPPMASPDEALQRIAAEVGFSETAFAAPQDDNWRVRYFAPTMEVPFCGHATIALGVALTLRQGNDGFTLTLNDGTGLRRAEQPYPGAQTPLA